MAIYGKSRKIGDKKHKWIKLSDRADKCSKCGVERWKVRDGYEYLFVKGKFRGDTVCYAPKCEKSCLIAKK